MKRVFCFPMHSFASHFYTRILTLRFSASKNRPSNPVTPPTIESCRDISGTPTEGLVSKKFSDPICYHTMQLTQRMSDRSYH